MKDNLVAAINEASQSESIAGYGVKYIAEGYIGENNEFICTTSSEEVIRRCSEIDDGCLCAIRIVDEDSYTITIAVTSNGVMAEQKIIATKEYVDNKKVVVKSSTAGSTKKFKITVDDAGTLSAVEVTTS